MREAVLLLFLLGLMIGSFCNVLLYRIPRGDSILTPRSQCLRCRHVLGAWDLVPVLSFLWLGGRCRYCRFVIPWRYPLLELVVAITGGVAGAFLGATTGLVLLLTWVVGCVVLALVRRYELLHNESGLSLVEVLVSLALFVLIVGPAFQALRVSREAAVAAQNRTLAVGLARDRIAYLSAMATRLEVGSMTWTYLPNAPIEAAWVDGIAEGYVVTATLNKYALPGIGSKKAWRVTTEVTCNICHASGPTTGGEVRLMGVVHE